MPVQIPSPRGRRLSLRDTVRFLFLIARARILDMRLTALYRRAKRQRREPHGLTLLRLMGRWLAIHEQIEATMPGIPEPPQVQEVRAILGSLSERP